MKNTGLTEIYFNSYREKHATVKLKSSAPVEGQLFTLSRATEEKNSCTSVIPQSTVGWAQQDGHNRMGKFSRPNSTRLWEMKDCCKSVRPSTRACGQQE